MRCCALVYASSGGQLSSQCVASGDGGGGGGGGGYDGGADGADADADAAWQSVDLGVGVGALRRLAATHRVAPPDKPPRADAAWYRARGAPREFELDVTAGERRELVVVVSDRALELRLAVRRFLTAYPRLEWPLRAKRWRWARVEGASEFGELYGVGGLGFRNAPGATKRERRIAAWQQRSERVARGGGGEDDAAATRQYNEYQDRTSVLVRRADKQAWDRTRAARRSGLQSTRAVATSAPLLTPPGAPALEDALATLEGALLQRATRARNARAQTMGMTKGRGL